MWKWFYSFRFYTYGRENYRNCMEKIFISNLGNLRRINFVFAIFQVFFSFYTFFIERNILKTVVCLAVAVVALLLFLYTSYLRQKKVSSKRLIYILLVIHFFNFLAFGIYLCIFYAAPGRIVSIFLVLLVCVLLMFINSPLFTFYLTLCAVIVFITLSVIIKYPEVFKYDIIATIITGCIAVYFNWYISKWRFELELSTIFLEEERKKYHSESTIDDLTQLNNRRGFMQTFQRYLTNYRPSDNWFCICITDIDFFKNYNDFYGHVKGDECLRSIAKAFKKLSSSHGVYSARIGGEEFAMLWFEKDISHADIVVLSLLEEIKNMKIPHKESKVSEYVTLSMGVFIERCGTTNDMQQLHDLADKALYIAKRTGRNSAIITGRDIAQYKITTPNS